MFCTGCGAGIENEAKFCSKCGGSINNGGQASIVDETTSQQREPEPNKAHLLQLTDDFIASPEFDVFIGKNSNKYRYQFEQCLKARRGKSVKGYVSWNWPAALIGGIWFAYRKMYLTAASVFFIQFVLPLKLVTWGVITFNSLADWILSFSTIVLVGMFANGFYIEHTVSKVAKAESRSHLALLGGTSYGAAFAAFAVLAVLLAAQSK